MKKKYNGGVHADRTIILKIQETLLNRFDTVLLAKGINRSETLRTLISAFADAHEKEIRSAIIESLQGTAEAK